MIVSYCFTNEWAKYIPVQLYSLFQKNPNIKHVYLVTDILDTRLSAIMKQYPCTWIKPPQNIFEPKNIRGRFTVATLWRLLLPSLLEESRCLYLDADTLVVDDISELFDIIPTTIAGVEDIGISKRHLIKLGHHGTYINAGVLVMNLDGLRREHLEHKWITLANKKHFPCQDQDIINVTTTPLLLPNIYNSSESTGFNKEAKILHYAGTKTENWVRDLPYGKVWSLVEELYNAKDNSLRLVRKG